MKNKPKALLYSAVVAVFLVASVFAFKKIFHGSMCTKHAQKSSRYTAKWDAHNAATARDVLCNTMGLAETVKHYCEADVEINNFAQSIRPPLSHWTTDHQRRVEVFRINKMCALQLQFDDIKAQFLKIKTSYSNAELEKFIDLAHLISDYCKESAKAADIRINNRESNNVLLAQLLARANKEVKNFDLELQRIFMKFQPFLSVDSLEAIKLNIDQKFAKEIRKYSEQRSEKDDHAKVLMFASEWPIISMYRCVNYIY